jgi:hypothetical protein
VHGKKVTKNTVHPRIIFKKYSDGSYTRNALLYQDIFKYSIYGKYKEDDGKSFRLWNLTKWLLEVNEEFINHFKDPSTRVIKTASRINDRTDRVRGKIEDLAKLGAVAQVCTTKESKGSGTVPIFQFTIVGHVIAWIIESTNIERRENAINQLYTLFQENFRNNPSCTDKFNLIYYQKCKECGLFGNFVDRYKELLESDVPIMNRHGFFQRLLILPMINIISNVDFYTIWKDSISELDPDTRTRFYHHIKLDLERRAEDECHAFGAFERLRFKVKDNPESVVVEGHCKACNMYRPAAYGLDSYLQWVIKRYLNRPIYLPCENCKKDTLEFPLLI